MIFKRSKTIVLNILMKNHLGHYVVNGKQYNSKSHALYDSSSAGEKINWVFNHDIWQNFSDNRLSTLGIESLDSVYKRRAQQLRDNYDYLILNYSGGPDSHNVLMTFINNNIHLNEVYVKYSNSVDSKLYTPNKTITGAENIFSEWDFCIKPTLEWLAKEHPNIKITVDDVFKKNPETILNDDTFFMTSHFLGAFEIIRQQTFADSLIVQADNNKKVCEIYGIDKPCVFSENNQFYLYFIDNASNVVAKNSKEKLSMNNVTELFYWSPDMPEIVFEQSHKLLEYFKKFPNLRPLHDIKIFKRNDSDRIERLRRLTISLIYNTWDHNKFQAKKPIAVNDAGRSRDLYLLNRPEFQNYIKKWRGLYNEWRSTITNEAFSGTQLECFFSKRYKVGEL